MDIVYPTETRKTWADVPTGAVATMKIKDEVWPILKVNDSQGMDVKKTSGRILNHRIVGHFDLCGPGGPVLNCSNDDPVIDIFVIREIKLEKLP